MGNKSILMSIRPQYVAKILNGEKTIEVRKKFPKDYVGWVYIYCTKGKPNIQQYLSLAGVGVIAEPIKPNYINGKVVGRFWCDKVEHFEFETLSRDMDGYWWDNGKLVENGCDYCNYRDICFVNNGNQRAIYKKTEKEGEIDETN